MYTNCLPTSISFVYNAIIYTAKFENTSRQFEQNVTNTVTPRTVLLSTASSIDERS